MTHLPENTILIVKHGVGSSMLWLHFSTGAGNMLKLQTKKTWRLILFGKKIKMVNIIIEWSIRMVRLGILKQFFEHKFNEK